MITEFRYRVVKAGHEKSSSVALWFVVDWDSLKNKPRLRFSRHLYSKRNAELTAQWLNERNAGYPSHPHLKDDSL